MEPTLYRVEPGLRRRRVLLIALLGAGSCTGQIGELWSPNAPPTGIDAPEPQPVANHRSSSRISIPPEPEDPCPPATPQRARRISLGEYETAVAELLGTGKGLVSHFAPEPSIHGFDNQADALAVSSGNLEEFVMTAGVAAEMTDVSRTAPCSSDVAPETCASSFISSFASRAYGRSLSENEQSLFLAVFRQGAALEGYERGIRSMIEAVLISPYFLYRSEVGQIRRGAPPRLERDEVANAVAFALTGMRPDSELSARAADDPDFLTPEVLREEATRLVATTSSRRHIARFLRGWLGIPDLRVVHKVPEYFPNFTPALRSDLDIEIDLFLDHVLRDEHGTLDALLTSPVSFANDRILSVVYAGDYPSPLTPPPAPPPGEFVKIVFNPKLRKGVLSLGGWLAAHSPVHRSSPVDRGLAVRTRFFCQDVLPPPPDAVVNVPGPAGGATTRQKFEQHSADPSCNACHRMMDPIGFGMEMMSGIGAYRETEAGFPIDSKGELNSTDVDGPFEGPAELADRLAESREVRSCFVVQAFRYVEGRDEEPADACEISALQEFFAPRERSIQALFTEMILHPRFIKRSFKP
jgi:hypothetical protein